MMEDRAPGRESHRRDTCGPLLIALNEAIAEERGGEVLVRSMEKSARIFTIRGEIAWVVCSTRSTTFFQHLIQQGCASEEALDAVYEECRRTGQNFGETIVEWDLIEIGTLRAELLSHLAVNMAEVLTWSDQQTMFLPHDRKFRGTLTFTMGEVIRAAVYVLEKDTRGLADVIDLSNSRKLMPVEEEGEIEEEPTEAEAEAPAEDKAEIEESAEAEAEPPEEEAAEIEEPAAEEEEAAEIEEPAEAEEEEAAEIEEPVEAAEASAEADEAVVSEEAMHVISGLQDVTGLNSVGLFSPGGALLAGARNDDVDLERVGPLALSIVSDSREASELIGAGIGGFLHIEAADANILVRLFRESKIDQHFCVAMMEPDANVALGRMMLESAIHELKTIIEK